LQEKTVLHEIKKPLRQLKAKNALKCAKSLKIQSNRVATRARAGLGGITRMRNSTHSIKLMRIFLPTPFSALELRQSSDEKSQTQQKASEFFSTAVTEVKTPKEEPAKTLDSR
jgi:hypothetical protein